MGTMLLDQLFRQTLNHLWQSTLFAGGVGLLALLLRGYAARYRFGLWLAASLKFLLPFALLAALGSHLAWRNQAPVIAPIALTVAAQPFESTGPAAAITPAAMSQPTDPAAVALLAIWLCGSLAVLGIWLRRWWRVAAAVGETRPVTGPLGDLPLPVRLTDSTTLEPGVFGIARPVLVLPADIADRLSAEQLQAVLAHELCHVRRRDNLWAALHMVVEAAFWFHPLVWFVGSRLVEERERACDEAVLAAGSDPEGYAQGILQICRHYVESPLACVAGVTGADLKRRLAAIMAQRQGLALGGGKLTALTALGLAAVAVPLAAGLVFHVPVPALAHSAPRPAAASSQRPAKPPAEPAAGNVHAMTPMTGKTGDSPTPAVSQGDEPSGGIAGKVIAGSGPLPNATVLIVSRQKTEIRRIVATDASGGFQVPRLEARRYQVNITADGYIPQLLTVNVEATPVRVPDVTLSPNGSESPNCAYAGTFYATGKPYCMAAIPKVCGTTNIGTQTVAAWVEKPGACDASDPGQDAQPAPRPQFEVASIKPTALPFPYTSSGIRPGNADFEGETLKKLIATAYQLQDFQIVGGPDWIATDRFDVEAKFPVGAAPADAPLMLQDLLAKRFALQVHQERKTAASETMVIIPGGPKMKPANCYQPELNDRTPPPGYTSSQACGTLSAGPNGFSVVGVDMDALAKELTSRLGHPVTNQTNLAGLYSLSLRYGMTDEPSIGSALADYGLKLQPARVQTETLVIDHAEKPTAN